MKKILLFSILSILLSGLVSCRKGAKKSIENVVKDTIVPIQTNILGFELGKTTPADAEKCIFYNNWEYFTSDFEGEYGIDITSRLTFGGVSWRGVGLSFLRNKLYLIVFVKDIETPETEKVEQYEILLKNLKKKYKKAIVKKNYFEAQDGKYSVTLTYDSLKRLNLFYAIMDDKLDSIIPAEM